MSQSETSSRWQHTWIGRCSKHGALQTAVRYSENGIAPSLPLEARYPGEFCFQCYAESEEAEHTPRRRSDG